MGPGLAWRSRPERRGLRGPQKPMGAAKRRRLDTRRLEATYRIRHATGGVRGPLVRSGFLSRWAQEVGGRREVPSEVIRVPRRGDEG